MKLIWKGLRKTIQSFVENGVVMDDRVEYVISLPKDDSEQKSFRIIGKKDDLIGMITITDQKIYVLLDNCELAPTKSSHRRREIEY